MHFMPEDEGYEEKLWPDGYKVVIREDLLELIARKISADEAIKNAHGLQNQKLFPDVGRFADRIAEMLVIGGEKGGDEAFDDIVTAFLYEMPLPEPRIYARYLLIGALPADVFHRLTDLIVEEYREDEVFTHAYRVGYWDLYADYDAFLAYTANLAAVGIINGLDDMLAAIYRSFAAAGPLPPARRNAKRVKNWFVPKGSKIRDIPLSRRARKRRERERVNAENSDMR